jgi:hypothetical protein
MLNGEFFIIFYFTLILTTFRMALVGLQNYTISGKLEEVFEKNGDLLQELWMVDVNNEVQYTIRVTELRDIQVVQYVVSLFLIPTILHLISNICLVARDQSAKRVRTPQAYFRSIHGFPQ